MKVKVGKDINWLIGIGFINLIMGVFCYFASISESNRVILFLLALIFYIFVFMYQKSGEHKALFLIVSIWQFTLMLDTIYRLVRYEKTPFEILNIFDILGLIFLMEMVIKGKLIIKKDSILIWFVGFAIYGIVITVINGSNIIDCLTALKYMFRFLGIYIYFSSNSIKMPSWVSYIAPVSLVAFVVEVLLDVNVDFRNGIFGYQYTSEMFPFVLVVLVSPLLIDGYKNIRYIYRMLLAFCGIEICFAFMEAKAEIILILVWMFVLFIILKAQNAWMKRFLFFLCGVVGLSFFWRVMININTKFSNLLNQTLFESIGMRLEKVINYSANAVWLVENSEIKYGWQSVFGVGMGAALPPQNMRWVIQSGESIDNLNSIFKASEIFQKYPRLSQFFGYSYYTTKLDLGIIGVLMLVVLFLMLFYRSFVLCRYSNDKYDNILGAVGVWQVIILFYRSYTSSIIIIPISMVVTFTLFGMISYRYKRVKRGDTLAK